MTYEDLRKELNDVWAAQIVDTSYMEYDHAKLVGNMLFTPVSHDQDTLERARDHINIYPMPYRGMLESSRMKNLKETLTRESLSFALKAEKDQLDVSKIRWVKQCDSLTASQWASLREIGAQYITKMIRGLEERNEMEVWSYLTLGRIVTIDDIVFELPVYGLNKTGVGSGICYHTRPSWFTSGGAVIPTADIKNDILSAIQAMGADNWDQATTIWMNPTTYNALLGNTDLNTIVEGLWYPIGLENFLGKDVNWWNQKNIMISKIKPFNNLTIMVNGNSYRNSSGVLTKYLPDYYVVYTPSKVGNRYVVPNPHNWNSARWARTFVTNDPEGMFFEVGERSLPYPDNTEWKSHYVQYVKAA